MPTLWKKSEQRHILNRFCKIIIIFLISFAGILSSQTRIEVDDIFDSQGDVTPMMFGNFFEFISNFINGSYGLWAQEINNRGFDLSDSEPKDGASDFWYKFNPSQTSDNKLELLSGGYNPNGKYYQRITKSANDDFGIYQNVYVYDTVGGDFYIYLKTKTPGTKVKIMLCDTSGNIPLFTCTISVSDTAWRKYSIKTPPIKKSHHVNLVIGIEGTGVIDIDEASFMAENNVDGIKHEYYRIFEEWKPGIIRYPGGWFADCRDNKLENCTGDIDKRFSPFSMGAKYMQRMDFGLEEFMRFCKKMEAEPHIVVNLETGTPQAAVNYLLYCNSDTNTAMGKLRKANGVAEPYNVKYWEVGNEQWLNLIKMATNYVPIYDAMKKTDPGIKIMINGYLWGGKAFFDTLFSIIGNRCDFYSYHDAHPALIKEKEYDETERYKSVVGSGFLPYHQVPMLMGWLRDNGQDHVKLALTEIFLGFGRPFDLNDSLDANSTLETGLWFAGYLNGGIRNCNDMPIFEKTFGIGAIKTGYNKKGDRIIYPTPTQQIQSFAKNHTGNKLLNAKVDCDYYNTLELNGLFTVYQIPYLDVAVTRDISRLYMSVLNRHPSDTLKTEILLPFLTNNYLSDVHEYNSKNYSDFSSYDEPDKLNFTHRKIYLNGEYAFPPHSYTILEIPISIGIFNDDTTSADYQLIVFPNPAVESLFLLKSDLFDNGDKVRIYNQLGEEVAAVTQTDKYNYIQIPVGNLPPGFYFGMINSNRNKMFKFIKL